MKTATTIFALFVSIALPAISLAHATLDHAEPAVGATVSPPAQLTIWYTEEINPDPSEIQVFDADGKQVDKKDSHLDEKDKTILIVSLPKLPAGTYKVAWHVECCDSHKTQGDFKFTVK